MDAGADDDVLAPLRNAHVYCILCNAIAQLGTSGL